jgi:hypothetical protein
MPSIRPTQHPARFVRPDRVRDVVNLKSATTASEPASAKGSGIALEAMPGYRRAPERSSPKKIETHRQGAALGRCREDTRSAGEIEHAQSCADPSGASRSPTNRRSRAKVAEFPAARCQPACSTAGPPGVESHPSAPAARATSIPLEGVALIPSAAVLRRRKPPGDPSCWRGLAAGRPRSRALGSVDDDLSRREQVHGGR